VISAPSFRFGGPFLTVLPFINDFLSPLKE
jgi:hypothetical protein